MTVDTHELEAARAFPAPMHDALVRLVTEWAWRIDRHLSYTLHELFVPEGRLISGGGQRYEGIEAIRAWGEKRRDITERTVRHFCSNHRFEATGTDTATGTTDFLLFRHDGPGRGIPQPYVLGQWSDDFIRVDDGEWRFTRHEATRIFGPQGAELG